MAETVERFTSKDGTQVACFVTGSGPPPALVHGTGADHARWAPVLSFPTALRGYRHAQRALRYWQSLHCHPGLGGKTPASIAYNTFAH